MLLNPYRFGAAAGPSYYNDFSDPSLAGFTSYADLGSGTPVWAVVGGELTVSGGTNQQCELVYDGISAADAYVEGVFLASSGGLCGRFVSITDHYLAIVQDGSASSPNTYSIYRRAGSHALIASGSIAPWTRGTPRTFRFEIIGNGANNVRLYDGGSLIAQVSDSSVTGAGRWGVYCYGINSNVMGVDSLAIQI